MIFDKNINIFFARDKFFITGIFLFIVNLRKNNIVKLQNNNFIVFFIKADSQFNGNQLFNI